MLYWPSLYPPGRFLDPFQVVDEADHPVHKRDEGHQGQKYPAGLLAENGECRGQRGGRGKPHRCPHQPMVERTTLMLYVRLKTAYDGRKSGYEGHTALESPFSHFRRR